MNNPYQILGVEQNATDEAVKEAYRILAEKYSTDNYTGSPLADLAKNKMDEINNAYDEIMNERRLGNAQSGQNSNGYSGSSVYDEIRMLLGSNKIDQAEDMLLQIPTVNRDAEWNYLMGNVNSTRGWLDEALRYYSAASSMDPNNPEYVAARSRMENGRRGYAPGNPYGTYNAPRSDAGCSGCDICTGLMCADCMCQCLGGRGICC